MRAYIVDIVDPQAPEDEHIPRMEEIENLIQTYGGIVIVKAIQKKHIPNYNTYIGSGKLEEIIHEMNELSINTLIMGNILKPAQTWRIKEKLRPHNIQVRDRVDLILKIFDKHATSAEAKLQIELAAIKHMGPRIFGMGMEMSRQGGGIGTKGIGETNTERMKRHLKEKAQAIKVKLQKYKKMRSLHRQRRKKQQLPTVGIVGYTNAGKSSLLNALTNKDVLAENKLFATLGTHVGKMFVMTDSVMGTGQEILLNDTIGFMRDLPPQLFQAFASTLEDSIHSDLLLHVIDSSDQQRQEKIQVVESILKQIDAQQPVIYVFNKQDRISSQEQTKQQLQRIQQHKQNNQKTDKHNIKNSKLPPNVYVSAYTQEGLDALQHMILDQYLIHTGK